MSKNTLLDGRALFGPDLSQVLQHVCQRQHVGVLLVHVEQVDGVGGFVPVENTLLDNDHAVTVGAAVQYAGPDAATGGRSSSSTKPSHPIPEAAPGVP